MLDRSLLPDDPGPLLDAALHGGVDWVQVRDRSLEGGALLDWTDTVCRAARRAAGDRRVLVNRRSDIALASGAEGVHLGFDAVSIASARRLLGDAATVGVSAHRPDEVAAAQGASYAHLAPIFAPLSKTATRAPLGLDALRTAAACGRPVLAQGGIDVSNAGAAISAGAAGVAVTGAILGSNDPLRATRALREALDA